uniref:AsIV-cont00086-ORF1 n=1 Tax=Apophua simplicipes ichnovirus TaxID=1329648 RepID=S5DR95_9VIRU|nr:AsIV-cont00086-ORF1 [Apophua simplicipes ichnovirus]
MDHINTVKYHTTLTLDRVKFNIRTKLREDMTIRVVKNSWSGLTTKLKALNSGYAALGQDDDDEKRHVGSVTVKSDLELKLAALRQKYYPMKQ